LLAQAEHEALCADQDAGRAEHEARKAEAVAAKLRDTAKACWAALAARQEEVDDLRRALEAARADNATRFVASLERASAVVKTWPLWKQQVLG
jgi:Skp family chaperone for outer membrane proteins